MSAPAVNGDDMSFKIIQPALEHGLAARVGRLATANRTPLDTPTFVGVTSRGAIPHLTPDVISKHTDIRAAYMALEDFIEKSSKRKSPAIFSLPKDGCRPLHAYTATPSTTYTILAPRRTPAVVAQNGNGPKHISVLTSTGFERVTCENFCTAVEHVMPDIVVPPADLTFSSTTPGAKRQIYMVKRTQEWLDEFFTHLDPEETLKPSGIQVFAPLLPLSYPIQWEYLKHLAEEHAAKLSGLTLYDVKILHDLKNHPQLLDLPRMSMESPESPQQILRQVRLGVDIFASPLVNEVSDAGIALHFSFAPSSTSLNGRQPLGIDLSTEEHQTSVKPFMEGCGCYACTKHHRAYLQHLMNAREMLGWTLLQIHNHHVMSEFFRQIRLAIADGTFEEKATRFNKCYESELPLGTGVRPRARGYHFKPEAGQPKINKAPWNRLEGEGTPDQVAAAEAAGLAVTGPAAGGSETPLVPEADAAALAKEGFAKIEGA
ncbi:tRNA-guanine transglycosylase [Apiospora rasikravindrae]|uniref:Queuine tRNA-ribosyltransferase accessory subunit 2 n=1 Tax=Apiospora rasikravindrae TaxID=990691 RepID=A0ABR1SMN3_9PEZI